MLKIFLHVSKLLSRINVHSRSDGPQVAPHAAPAAPRGLPSGTLMQSVTILSRPVEGLRPHSNQRASTQADRTRQGSAEGSYRLPDDVACVLGPC